ncbi:MAG: hypothetical protein J6A79_14955 [Clostridia bacterium]|nr:hypothetical protein [Clostridia bacterium]
MKIRTDFVTNSSSSNYTLELTVKTANASVSLTENPQFYSPDSGGEASFTGNLREINDYLGSVEELAEWLADCVENDDYEDEENGGHKLQRKRDRFISDMCKKIKDVREIERITVLRQYNAWGEFADLVADNDVELKDLAKEYLQSKGEEKEKARAAMVTFIQTTTEARGDSFGEGLKNNRYRWNGKNLDAIAKRLLSNMCADNISGRDRRELNLKTGEYFEESEFDLA